MGYFWSSLFGIYVSLVLFRWVQYAHVSYRLVRMAGSMGRRFRYVSGTTFWIIFLATTAISLWVTVPFAAIIQRSRFFEAIPDREIMDVVLRITYPR